MLGADTCICRLTRVRLWDRLKAYGVGVKTTTDRCKGVLLRVGGGGAAKLGGRVCDVVVTPCDACRLEMTRAQIDALLLLCIS